MSEVMDNPKVNVLNAEWLKTRKEGDTFEIEGLFQGVTKEPIVYKVEKVKIFNKSSEYTFIASYLGVKLSESVVTIKKDGTLKIQGVELK